MGEENLVEGAALEVLELREQLPALGGSEVFDRGYSSASHGRLEEAFDIVGREPEAAVWIDDSAVSRRHARIVVDNDRATLEDLGSKNGTKLQGKKIRSALRLADRDAIAIGPASIVFRVYRQTGSTETAAEDEPPA